MDTLTPMKSFLKDILEPIVIEAVKSAIPAKNDDDEYLSIEDIQDKYHISPSTVYRRFTTGELTKVKNGSRTLVLKRELDNCLKEGKWAGIDTKLYKKRCHK